MSLIACAQNCTKSIPHQLKSIELVTLISLTEGANDEQANLVSTKNLLNASHKISILLIQPS